MLNNIDQNRKREGTVITTSTVEACEHFVSAYMNSNLVCLCVSIFLNRDWSFDEEILFMIGFEDREFSLQLGQDAADRNSIQSIKVSL